MSEALQRHIGPMPTWLMFSGATIGIVGASVTKHAESVGAFVVALDSRAGTWRRPRPDGGGSGCLSSGQLWRSLGLLSQLALSNLRRRSRWSPAPTATWEPNQNASIFGPACKRTPRLARLAASAASMERVIITQPELTLHGEIALWSSG
jgi:hypothetical protein